MKMKIKNRDREIRRKGKVQRWPEKVIDEEDRDRIGKIRGR